MGDQIKRLTPRALPTKADIKKSHDRVVASKERKAQPFTMPDLKVAGSRGLKVEDNRDADFAIHGVPRWVNASASDFAGKHLVIFLHGYNVPTAGALDSAHTFFGRLHDAVVRDGGNPADCAFLGFGWPGDTGVIHFNAAQRYAHHSGVALYELIQQVSVAGAPLSISIAAHSLGVHVALRAAAVLGIQRINRKATARIDRMLLLGAAVEDDVFERVDHIQEYHFPEAAFATDRLHITASRSDEVLAGAFRLNEFDRALGHRGPPTMEPLVSLARRRREEFEGETFAFRVHDLSPNSSATMNPDLAVDNHGDYWATPLQLNYYVNYLR